MENEDRRGTAAEEARILLDARMELYGESEPETLDAMEHLALSLREAGEYREAEALLTRSLSLQAASPERNDARRVRTEYSLALVLDRLGELDAARRVWERVLTDSDEMSGTDSDQSIRAATNLAISLRKLHRYGEEFPLRVRVYESIRRAAGPEHLDTYRSLVDLAQTHRSLGNHEMALSQFTEAVSGLERNGADPRLVLYQKWAMVSELVALKRRKEASALFDQVLAGAREQLDPDDPLRRRAVRQRRAYWLLSKLPERKA